MTYFLYATFPFDSCKLIKHRREIGRHWSMDLRSKPISIYSLVCGLLATNLGKVTVYTLITITLSSWKQWSSTLFAFSSTQYRSINSSHHTVHWILTAYSSENWKFVLWVRIVLMIWLFFSPLTVSWPNPAKSPHLAPPFPSLAHSTNLPMYCTLPNTKDLTSFLPLQTHSGWLCGMGMYD